MVRHMDSIFSQGAFRPMEVAEGTRIHLSVEEETNARPVRSAAKILTPRLAHPEETGDFVMEVWETGDAPL